MVEFMSSVTCSIFFSMMVKCRASVEAHDDDDDDSEDSGDTRNSPPPHPPTALLSFPTNNPLLRRKSRRSSFASCLSFLATFPCDVLRFMLIITFENGDSGTGSSTISESGNER